MIVVDTTVWIELLEGTDSIFDQHLAAMIAQGLPVALTDLIYCEILQGIRDDVRYHCARVLRAYPILRVRGLETFERAANIYRSCRKRGITVRKTIDCLIAATCLETEAELFHNDRDFEAIARVEELKIYRPAV